MRLTIDIPDLIVTKWLESQQWTADTGCPFEASRYAEEKQRNPDIGDYKPCTAEDMVLWEIEHHFAGTALAALKREKGMAEINKLREDQTFKTVFYTPELQIKESVRER